MAGGFKLQYVPTYRTRLIYKQASNYATCTSCKHLFLPTPPPHTHTHTNTHPHTHSHAHTHPPPPPLPPPPPPTHPPKHPHNPIPPRMAPPPPPPEPEDRQRWCVFELKGLQQEQVLPLPLRKAGTLSLVKQTMRARVARYDNRLPARLPVCLV